MAKECAWRQPLKDMLGKGSPFCKELDNNSQVVVFKRTGKVSLQFIYINLYYTNLTASHFTTFDCKVM